MYIHTFDYFWPEKKQPLYKGVLFLGMSAAELDLCEGNLFFLHEFREFL